MHKYVSCIAGCLLLIVLCFQGNALAQDDEVLAKIGDKNFTIADFKKVMSFFDPGRQQMIEQNPQLKENFLRQLIQTMVIAEIAKRAGYDKRPEIREQLKFFEDSFIANEYLKREISGKVTVSEDDIKSYYDTHPDEFKVPEMVKARHILVKVSDSASEEEKKQAKEKAEGILKKIKAGEDFIKLASEVSDDPGSKSKGGDLGLFPKGRMVKSFEDVAFSLKPGEISEIVESQFGYHIIKVEEKKDSSQKPFDAVKERIHQKLAQERKQSEVSEFIDKAMKDADVEIYIGESLEIK